MDNSLNLSIRLGLTSHALFEVGDNNERLSRLVTFRISNEFFQYDAPV